MMQRARHGMKLVKLKSETVSQLDNLIKKMETKQPYLKGLVSYNTVIMMLLLKNKIKVTKYKYLIKHKGGKREKRKS